MNEDWKTANFLYFKDSMRPPNFELSYSEVALGRWKGGCHRHLSISINLIKTYAWEYVQEVLYHEMAHQYVEEVLGICEELPHGEAFKRVCQEKGIDPTATGDIQTWMEKRKNRFTVSSENHQILDKVHKLLALAQSPNEHEAQTAMAKAHELLLRHNLSLLDTQTKWNYIHKQVGEIGRRGPAKSIISAILCKYFFCRGHLVLRIRPAEKPARPGLGNLWDTGKCRDGGIRVSLSSKRFGTFMDGVQREK